MSTNGVSLFCLFLVLALHTVPATSRAAVPKCYGMVTALGVSEDTCPHGEVAAWCPNVKECGKGPGTSCGGNYNAHGQCGTGMFCGCGVCNGCDKHLDCYFQPKC